MNCDPAAEKYKTKFKKNKDDLVAILFKLFNEKVFDNKVNLKVYFIIITDLFVSAKFRVYIK